MASFDENGKYIKTNWKAGDKITATKLNKIEESIEAVNDNDISRHVEADARLDALEAKDVAHDKELTNIKNTIADNKAEAELGDYEINSRMTFLENELNEGIEEVHNVAETVDGKIAQAEANMTAQVNTAKDEMTAQVNTAKDEMTAQVNQGKADMEAMVAEVEADLEHIGNNIPTASVKIFGAKGDGVTDDSDSIQNAINEITTTGGVLIFPKGEYLVSKEFIITSKKDIIIMGQEGSVIKMADNSNVTMFYLRYCENVTFEKITMDGNRDNNVVTDWPHGTCGAIISSSGKHITIDNCRFYNFHYGVCPSTNGDVINAKVINCYFENCNSDIDTYCKSLQIIGNVSYGCTQNSIQVESIGTITDDLPNYEDEEDLETLSVNNIVSNNSIINCAGIGINVFSASINTIVSNNNITNVGKTGILADKIDAKNLIITNNTISNNNFSKETEDGLPQSSYGSGIALSSGYNFIISNNVISHCRTGIYGYKLNRASINNNMISHCKTSGICLLNDNSTKVNDNYMFNNSLSEEFWANAGIHIKDSVNTYTSNNFTKDTNISNDYRQRSCVYIFTGCSDITCVGDLAQGTLEGSVNNNSTGRTNITDPVKQSYTNFFDGITSKEYKIEGIKVIGEQQAAIDEAIDGTEVQTINKIINVLRAHGLISS